MTDRLSRAELATAAGTTEEVVARFLALGIIRTSPDGDFLGSDIARVRLGMALESSGVSLDSVGEAIRTGRLSLGFIDQLLPQPGRLLPRTQRDVIEGLDIPWSLADRVRTILGSAGQSPDEPIREDDAEIFEVVARARELGLDDERGIRVIRVIADNVRRIVEAEADVLDEVLTREALASGLSDQEMLDRMAPTRSEYRRLGGRLLDLVNRRLIDEGVIRVLVDYLEAALVREGITPPREDRPPAIAFADLSGFTRLTEERGDRAAATHAGTLAEVAQQAANPLGGQLVKVLGDGAMLFFPDGTAAVHGALELLREARARGLPPARVGIDTGHVIRQDGDYFGTTVNVAARVTDYARPREVLVTSDVVERWTGGDGVLFEEIGPVPLKNVAEPVSLHRAFRPDDRAGQPGSASSSST